MELLETGETNWSKGGLAATLAIAANPDAADKHNLLYEYEGVFIREPIHDWVDVTPRKMSIFYYAAVGQKSVEELY